MQPQQRQNWSCDSMFVNKLFLVAMVLCQAIQHSWANVMVNAELGDGQFSRFISLDGLRFKETSLTPEAGKSPTTLWQFSNKNSFFQLIFRDGLSTMVDCERIRQRGHINEFSRKFDKDLSAMLNQTSDKDQKMHHNYQMLPTSDHEFNQFLDSGKLPADWAFENEAEFNDILDINQRDQFYFAKPTKVQRISGVSDLPEELKQLADLKNIADKCDQWHRNMKQIAHGLVSQEEEHRQNATVSLSRRKRAISDLFLAPNTRWCGKGSATSSYLEIGGHSRADKCCRKHDHCKMNIHAMSMKFRMFNYRPYTISHCNCDRRFRTCLKMADSSDANLVGNLFFNIIKTKCFVLKPEKYCKQYNHATKKCEKKGLRKRAHLRDNRGF